VPGPRWSHGSAVAPDPIQLIAPRIWDESEEQENNVIIGNRTDRWARHAALEDAARPHNRPPARLFTAADSRPFTVLILDGESHFALSVARCLAAAKNVRTHVLSEDPRAVVRFSNTIESFRTWGGIKGTLAAEQCSERAREI
jgi:hypothetical protein